MKNECFAFVFAVGEERRVGCAVCHCFFTFRANHNWAPKRTECFAFLFGQADFVLFYYCPNAQICTSQHLIVINFIFKIMKWLAFSISKPLVNFDETLIDLEDSPKHPGVKYRVHPSL